jgi:hypothetical protein
VHDARLGIRLVSRRQMGFPTSTQLDAGITVARWGGVSTTRYNYEIDVHNEGATYFFENLPGCWTADQNFCAQIPTDPMGSSSANAFLSTVKQRGVVSLFTIPTIGWVPKSPAKYNHPFDCGCPRTSVPTQDLSDL